jgi:hypothetical protein
MSLTDLAAHWGIITGSAATFSVASVLGELDVAPEVVHPTMAVSVVVLVASLLVYLGRSRGVQVAETVYLGRLRQLREQIVAHAHEETDRRLARLASGERCGSPTCYRNRAASTDGLRELVSKSWDASRKDYGL